VPIFDVLKPAGDDDLTVSRLDIVVWSLQGLFRIQRLVIDVSVLLRNDHSQSSLQDLSLLVPFRVSPQDQVSPLWGKHYHELVNPALRIWSDDGDRGASSLSFSEPLLDAAREIRATLDSQDHYEGRSDKVIDRILRRSRSWTIVPLHLDKSVPPAEYAYVRMRFSAGARTSAVFWKRSGLGVNGALYDLRTYLSPGYPAPDLRGILSSRGAEVEISTITCVVRASWQLRSGFPTVSKVKLEPSSWGSYLDRATDLRDQGALVAYSASSTDSHSAGPGGRVGMFLDVSREFGLLPFGNFVRTALAVLAALAVAAQLGLVSGKESLHNIATDVSSFFVNNAALLGITGGGIVFLTLLSRIEQVAVRLRSLGRRLLALQDVLYQKILALWKSGR